MINKIIIGISQALNSEFNAESDTYSIYNENVEQGLDVPCFLITVITHSHDKKLCNRYNDSNSFVVQYIPSTTNFNNEINEIVSRLEYALETISVDNSIVHGSNIESESKDGILNFKIDYNIRVTKQVVDDPTMNALDYNN